MYTILKKGNTNVPIKSWLPWYEVDSGTFDQLINAANHPEVGPHIASMPDAHVGYGVSIGCVFPTVNAVIPNAVGVDIGCGVCATNTGLKLDESMDEKFWNVFRTHVNRLIPTGFAWHDTVQPLGSLERDLRAKELQPLVETKAAAQIGTLGGGNHFLEAQVDEEGYIWLMVHSGSRNTGLRIANHYNKIAIEDSAKRKLGVTKDLASLRLDEQNGQDYVHDMQWATDFALASRQRMIEKMVEALILVSHENIALECFINCHHNFASLEKHYGQKMMVHRKGATGAAFDELGIIPGSMGSNSYIVRGRGIDDSFNSCSHGAGRRMGRGKAKEMISLEDFEYALQGTFSKASRSYVDEAPQAYKDIEKTMRYQTDLVDIARTLKPIITMKGDSKAKED